MAELKSDVSSILKGELGRGAYDARRAAQLAGVPASTLDDWAREDFYCPSVSSSPRLRLWSWLDLVALRIIDYLNKSDDADGLPRVDPANVRRVLKELDREGIPREELSRAPSASLEGDHFLEVQIAVYFADGGTRVIHPLLLRFIKPYRWGPDLLQPRPLIRILPGKLHGEPHLLNTRIPSAAVYALDESGYSHSSIQRMYPDAPLEALVEAIDLERSLSEHGS